MVRIKKENYEKLKKKRKLQQLDEEFKQGYIEKFVVYKEENNDFLLWLYNFYWDYYKSQWYDFLEVNTSSMDLTKPLECKSLPKDLLYEKYNKTGFDLYENLQEWKREMNAPTRDDPEYRKMKKRVRKRDNNTCQCCGYHSDKKTHHKLEVHHIFGYKDHLDYRVEDSNCVVLCQDCHKKYHSLYGRKEVAPDTFMKFIRDYNNFHNGSMQTTLEVYHA